MPEPRPRAPSPPAACPPTPSLGDLMFHLQGLPGDLRAEPRIRAAGVVVTEAVVFDLMLELGGGFLPLAELRRFRVDDPLRRNRARLQLFGAWLFHHPFFRQGPGMAQACARFLDQGLKELAEVVDAERVLNEDERREEFIRRALDALGLHPAGEDAVSARDRLAGVDSVAQAALVAEARLKLKREREAEIAKKKQEEAEAAARYGRE